MTVRSELWNRLVESSVVSGAMPANDATASAWYVTAMIAVSAWVASVFLLIFFAIAFQEVIGKPAAGMTVGAVICVACAALMHVAKRRLFIAQLAVAMSLVGQAFIALGILDTQWKSAAAWLAFAAVESVLVFAAPNYVHRVIVTLAAAWSLRFGLAAALVAPLFLPLCIAAFVASERASQRFAWSGWSPITVGLALGALFTIPVALSEIFWWPGRDPLAYNEAISWFVAVALAVTFVVVIAGILRPAGAAWTSRTAVVAFAAAVAAALAARPVPGVIAGAIVLVVAYSQGRRALCGLAIAGIVAALSQYYYALDTTLLAKAGALFATGIVLVVAGIAVRLGLAEEPPHA